MDLAAVSTLLATRGQRLLPGSYAVPVELLVALPDATVARFTARGTSIRLALFAADAMSELVLPTACGCGGHHESAGPVRTWLHRDAVPVAERMIDGRAAFGWTGHEAGLLRLDEAVPYYVELLGMLGLEPVELSGARPHRVEPVELSGARPRGR